MIYLAPLSLLLVAASGADPKKRLTNDGLEFTVEQKDYKPRRFKMFGQEFDDTFGFAGSSYLPLDHRGYAEVVEGCDFEADSIPLYQYSKLGTVNYYPDTTTYDAFSGYDLIPENKDNYSPGSDYESNMNFKKWKEYAKDPIMMQRCRIPQDDGGAWHVQRVGPFVSRGGYDWWQIAWPDVAMLSEALAKHPEGYDVIRHIFTPVLKNNTRLSFPPLHVHHIHVVPQDGVRPRLLMRPMCLQKFGLGISALDEMVHETECYNTSMAFEHHGDYVCRPEDDGLDCLTQDDKTPTRMIHPYDLEGEINDVRPANSEPLEWYYFVAFRWRPIDPQQPVISHVIEMSPGRIIPPSQLTKSFTFPVPTNAQTMSFYTSKMIVGGELVRGKIHAHSGIFESCMLLLGKPEDFGLNDPKFIPNFSYEPLVTTQLGFRDNEDLAQHILFHMRKSQATYDAVCTQEASASRLRNPICARPRPDWVCGGVVDFELVAFDGVEYPFDRRMRSWCKPWTFEIGDDITSVHFGRHVTRPSSPVNPGVIAPIALEHLAIGIIYIDKTRGYSYSDMVLNTHNGPFYYQHMELSPPALIARALMIVFFSGPPVFSSTLMYVEWLLMFVFTAIAVSVGYGMVALARRVSAVDEAFVAAWDLILDVCTTRKPKLGHGGGAEKVSGLPSGEHKYEMVRLTDNDPDLSDEDVRA